MAVVRRLVVVSVIFGWLLLVSPKVAFPALFGNEFDNEFDEKPWQEIEVQLPAFPQSENLISLTVGAMSDKQFLIDEKSISIGSDEVIRYSLIVISSSGARNISYEGMRCATAERRVYAFGQADGTWSKARSNKWVSIRAGSNPHHIALFGDYFCAIGQRTIMQPEDAVRVLRYGVQNTGT
jgi:hypothetical protein